MGSLATLFRFTAGCIFAAIAGATDPVNAIVFAKVLAIFTLNDPEEQSDLAILYGLVYLALGAISLLAFTVEVVIMIVLVCFLKLWNVQQQFSIRPNYDCQL